MKSSIAQKPQWRNRLYLFGVLAVIGAIVLGALTWAGLWYFNVRSNLQQLEATAPTFRSPGITPMGLELEDVSSKNPTAERSELVSFIQEELQAHSDLELVVTDRFDYSKFNGDIGRLREDLLDPRQPLEDPKIYQATLLFSEDLKHGSSEESRAKLKEIFEDFSSFADANGYKGETPKARVKQDSNGKLMYFYLSESLPLYPLALEEDPNHSLIYDSIQIVLFNADLTEAME